MSVARLDAFEARMEVGAEKIPGRLIEPVEQVRAKQRLVDHDSLGGRERSRGGSSAMSRTSTRVPRSGGSAGSCQGPTRTAILSKTNACRITTPPRRRSLRHRMRASASSRPKVDTAGPSGKGDSAFRSSSYYSNLVDSLRRDYHGGSAQATQRTDL